VDRTNSGSVVSSLMIVEISPLLFAVACFSDPLPSTALARGLRVVSDLVRGRRLLPTPSVRAHCRQIVALRRRRGHRHGASLPGGVTAPPAEPPLTRAARERRNRLIHERARTSSWSRCADHRWKRSSPLPAPTIAYWITCVSFLISRVSFARPSAAEARGSARRHRGHFRDLKMVR